MNKYVVSKIVNSVLLLAFFNSTAWAVEQHDVDIQPWLSQGKVQLNSTLFETDFGDLSGGLYKTDDPGYDVDDAKGAFTAGNWLRYEGLGTLKFWDSGSWTSTLLNDEQVRIEDALGNTTTFSGTGISNPVGVIGEVDADGDVHEHIDMSIWDNTGNLGGATGAYWISLALFDTLPNDDNPVSQASDTLNIIFNRGLSEEQYELAVAAVPVPAAIYFFISGILGLGWINSGKRRCN